jgi:hypothetical protein
MIGLANYASCFSRSITAFGATSSSLLEFPRSCPLPLPSSIWSRMRSQPSRELLKNRDTNSLKSGWRPLRIHATMSAAERRRKLSSRIRKSEEKTSTDQLLIVMTSKPVGAITDRITTRKKYVYDGEEDRGGAGVATTISRLPPAKSRIRRGDIPAGDAGWGSAYVSS